MKKNSKQLILEKGSELISIKGFHHTGIQEILNSADIPKGSFYFYFKNKEDFGLQLIDSLSVFFLSKAEFHLSKPDIKHIDRLKAFFEFYQNHLEKCKFVGGCPIGNLAQELGDINIKFRNKLNDTFDKMKLIIQNCLENAVIAEELTGEVNTAHIANFILNSWEGAVLRSKVTKNSEPLKIFTLYIFDYVLQNK